MKDNWDHKNEVHLEKEDPKAFDILVDWMFRGVLPSILKISYTKLANVYCLADFLIMPQAKNEVVDSILRLWAPKKTCLNMNGLRHIHDGGAFETPLFDLAVRSATRCFMVHGTTATLTDELIGYPHVMLALLKSIDQWRVKSWEHPTLEDKCTWHNHKDGGKCQSDL